MKEIKFSCYFVENKNGNLIFECFQWKERWGVLKKLSPVASKYFEELFIISKCFSKN